MRISLKCTSIQPLEMSQKFIKNLKYFYFIQKYPEIATRNVAKLKKKFQNISIGIFHPNVLENSHWKCHKISKQSFPLVFPDIQVLATGNVTKHSFHEVNPDFKDSNNQNLTKSQISK